MSTKHEDLNTDTNTNKDDEIVLWLDMNSWGKRPISHKVIKDNIVSLAFAIGDTTCSALTWFLWLLLKHSHVETKIRQKLRKVLSVKGAKPSLVFSTEDLSKMVYLHAALCERDTEIVSTSFMSAILVGTHYILKTLSLYTSWKQFSYIKWGRHNKKTEKKYIFWAYKIFSNQYTWNSFCKKFFKRKCHHHLLLLLIILRVLQCCFKWIFILKKNQLNELWKLYRF